MITVRKSDDRGHANYGWLDTYHTFSFNDYHDPKYMGFRSLRVINEDRVAPEAGFPTHAHRDMEILTYIIDGALQHRDSMGHGEVIRPGEIQRMTAGRGVTHSEFNASRSDPVHLLQIWILPTARGLEPGYEQIRVGGAATPDRLQLIASPEGGDGAVSIHQDARLYRGLLPAGARLNHALDSARYGYVQLVSGALEVNGQALAAGDGAEISAESSIGFAAKDDAEFLLFDLA
jgi:redox-sensitive bicupin YhaK (pirin superfamily)